MEVSKVVPTLLHKYRFSFTPRSARSPHRQEAKGVDGRMGEEPWHVVSHWVSDSSDMHVINVSVRQRKLTKCVRASEQFAHQSDFWVDYEEREM